jgi:hypothetical protein
MATKKKTPAKTAAKRKAPAAKPTSLQVNTTTRIDMAEGATFREAATAVLSDLQRRVNSGDLTSLEVNAYARNGNQVIADI